MLLFTSNGPFSHSSEYNALQEPLKLWVIFSVWLNDPRNNYPVKADLNQVKRSIKWDQYPYGNNQDTLITKYLRAPVQHADEQKGGSVTLR